MNQKIKFVGLLAILPLVMVALAPDYIGEADASKSKTGPQETGYTFSKSGTLTAPSDDKPFGGKTVGNYLLKANDNNIKVNAEIFSSTSAGMVFEGWLVDVDTGYKLSIGQFNPQNNRLSFEQNIVNPWIYNVLVITEEPKGDTDPSPNKPIGGTPLSTPWG